jgi:dimethylaniline monooxygenase (N-oxide forming)
VIGAGSSGIAAVKALAERGIPVDCFEKSDRAGGNWVFANNNGSSAAYRSLHTNTGARSHGRSDRGAGGLTGPRIRGLRYGRRHHVQQ